jgi:hypothetical protein
MAEGAMAITVEPNLGGNDGQRRRLALRAVHENTSGAKTSENTKQQTGGESQM